MSEAGDIIDRANDQAQMILDRNLAAARSSTHALPYTGRCHNCNDPVEAEHKFCDTYCRDDWQTRHPNQ